MNTFKFATERDPFRIRDDGKDHTLAYGKALGRDLSSTNRIGAVVSRWIGLKCQHHDVRIVGRVGDSETLLNLRQPFFSIGIEFRL